MPTSAPSAENGEMRLIARAAALLRALADQPSGASLGELAKATGLARSTVQRVVGALAAERLVSAGADGVRLGLEIARLASFVQSDARELLRPVAEALMRRVQETVDLTVLDGATVVVIDQLVSPQSLRVVSHVGRSLPLHATASGKAHLASLPRDERGRLLGEALKATSARTQTSAPALLREIEASIARGYFVDDEEFADGVCAVAISAPLPGGANCALAVSMPASRYVARLQACLEALDEARAAIPRVRQAS